MNKLPRPNHLPLIVTAAALVGLLLRIWTIGNGPDHTGLYAPQPLAWALLWILTALTLGTVVLLSAPLKISGQYKDEFPPSITATVGALLAAFAFMTAGLKTLSGNGGTMGLLTGLSGVAATMFLLLATFARYRGKRHSFPLHIPVCLYLALRVFEQSRAWGNEPQIGTILLPFLASICVMLAAYQLACFDVGLGKRRLCVFWNLSAVYFSLLSLPGSDALLFHSAMAIWMLTGLCSLRPRMPETLTHTDDSADTPDGTDPIANDPA